MRIMAMAVRGWRRHCLLCRRPLRSRDRPRIGPAVTGMLRVFVRRIHETQCMPPANFRAPVYRIPPEEVAALKAMIQGTKTSFLGYDYPILYPLVSFHGIQVADPRDIAGMKISAVASRGSRRDFVDLYAVSQKYGLGKLLQTFHKKFAKVNYSFLHVLKSLTYFEDAEQEPMPDMLVPLAWDEVKQFFYR